jgi:hypothetical protein
MSLAPICILYCKQCITMNEYSVDYFGWLSLMSTLEESLVAQRFG